MIKITLFELLYNERDEFNLLKKLKIYSISSISFKDILSAPVEEYFIDDVPFRLLKRKVASAYYCENTIEIFTYQENER